MIEEFVGFYPSRAFWAVEPIDFTIQENLASFPKVMEEVVLRYQKDEFRLDICRDGMLMLQICELESNKPGLKSLVKWWGRYLDYLNCLYLLLDSSVMKLMQIAYITLVEVTHRDVFRIKFENGQFKSLGYSGDESFASIRIMERTMRDSFLASLHSYSVRLVLNREVFDDLVKNFAIVVADKSLVITVSTISKSLSEYKIGNFHISLMLSWFVIELMLTKKWKIF